MNRFGAWNAWIIFFLNGVAEQAKDTAQRSHRLLALLEGFQAWGLSASRTGNLAKLVEFLFIRPVISLADAEEWLWVTQPGASRLIQQLVDQGILVEITGRQRNRRFAAREIIDIVSPPGE